jgi:hypothetical protein
VSKRHSESRNGPAARRRTERGGANTERSTPISTYVDGRANVARAERELVGELDLEQHRDKCCAPRRSRSAASVHDVHRRRAACNCADFVATFRFLYEHYGEYANVVIKRKEERASMPGGKRANVKNEKQYEALKDKGMSKERAAKIANSPGASSRGGKKSGSSSSSRSNSSQGGTTAQKKAAGRKGGKAAARKS